MHFRVWEMGDRCIFWFFMNIWLLFNNVTTVENPHQWPITSNSPLHTATCLFSNLCFLQYQTFLSSSLVWIFVFRCVQQKAFRHISRAGTRNLENPWHCCVQVWKSKRGEKEDKTEKCAWLRISVMCYLRWIILWHLEIAVKDNLFVYKIDFHHLIWRTHILTGGVFTFLGIFSFFISLLLIYHKPTSSDYLIANPTPTLTTAFSSTWT